MGAAAAVAEAALPDYDGAPQLRGRLVSPLPSDLPSLEDLLAGSAAGDEADFAALYHRVSGMLFGAILQFVRRREWAEEVLQDAFTRIWRMAGRYDPARAKPTTWMIAIARNAAIDRLRQERREVLAADQPAGVVPEPASDPREALACCLTARRLGHCIEGLDAGPRRAMMLAYYEGCTHEELAAQLGVPLGTAKSWIRRGLLQLKACLDP